MNELKPTGFETADALDRFRAVRRGMPYKTLWPSDFDEAVSALEEKLNRLPAPENKPDLSDIDRVIRLYESAADCPCDTYARLILAALYEYKDHHVVNKPLTLEQLRQMDGEPVWAKEYLSGKCGYGIVRKQSLMQNFTKKALWLNDYDKTWLSYARKPEVERWRD